LACSRDEVKRAREMKMDVLEGRGRTAELVFCTCLLSQQAISDALRSAESGAPPGRCFVFGATFQPRDRLAIGPKSVLSR
jgi:hypothetical protein